METLEDHPHVLLLILGYVDDVKTIVRLCNVSKQHRAACKARVRQQLPRLLVAAHREVIQEFDKDNNGGLSLMRAVTPAEPLGSPLESLYKLAGPAAVAAPAVAEALLRLSPAIPGRLSLVIPWMAIAHGLQLSAEAVLSAAKRRVGKLELWLALFLSKAFGGARIPKEWGGPRSRTLRETSPDVARCARLLEDEAYLMEQLGNIGAEEMPGLLHLAINSQPAANPNPGLLLLQHDATHTHVLYSSVNDNNDNVNNSVNASNSNNGSHNSDNHDSVVLAEQLLTTAIIRGHADVVAALVNTPAAKALSRLSVIKLLYLALKYDHGGRGYSYGASEAVVSEYVKHICSIPATQTVQADIVASLIRIAIKEHRYGFAELFASLPQANQFPSNQLCELLLAAIDVARKQAMDVFWERGQRDLVKQLAGLQGGQDLAAEDARRLLKVVVEHPWGPISNVMQDLAPLRLESQVTKNEVLNLLISFSNNRTRRWDSYNLRKPWDTLKPQTFQPVLPAPESIEDEAGLVAFIEQVFGVTESEVAYKNCVDLLAFMQMLGPASIRSLLQTCIDRGRVPYHLMQLPVLQQLHVEAVGELLIQAAGRRMLHQMRQLMAVPAATHLPAPVLQRVLHQALTLLDRYGAPCGNDSVCLSDLLALPAAGQLTAHGVSQLISVVLGRTTSDTTKGKILGGLLQLPCAVMLPGDCVVQLLGSIMGRRQYDSLKAYCRLPAAQCIDEVAAQQVYQIAVMLGDLQDLCCLRQHLPHMIQVEQATQLSKKQLMNMLNHAAIKGDCIALGLLQQAGAAGIGPDFIAKLMEGVLLSLPPPSDTQVCDEAFDATELDDIASCVQGQICCRPEVQSLSVDVVAKLVDFCMPSYDKGVSLVEGFRLIALLPAAAQLSIEFSESVLQSVVQVALRDEQFRTNTHAIGLHKLKCVLQLPSVQALPTLVVTQQLLLGIQNGIKLPALKLLTKHLTGFDGVSSEEVKKLLRAAVESQVSMVVWRADIVTYVANMVRNDCKMQLMLASGQRGL